MKVDRRRMLQTTAAVVAAASLPTLSKQAGALTLVDATLTESELHAAGVSARTSAEAVQPDLVRQWRDGLGAEIAAADTVTAYVRWDKALLLVGLARESRIAYRAVQLHRSVFLIVLLDGITNQN
jgi:hypothetical protein